MKTKDKKPKKTPRVFSLSRWRKLYVSAVEAHPGDFSEAEPSGNLARIFVVLLLVHVFLIGSIVVYNIVAERPRLDRAITAAPPVKPKAVSPKPVDVVKATPSAPSPAPATPPPAPKPDLRVYEVGSGDSIPSIAAKFSVDADDLLKLNHLDDGGEIYPGKKLTIPANATGNSKTAPAAIVQSLPVAAFVNTPPAPVKPTPAPAPAAAAVKQTPPAPSKPAPAAEVNKPADVVPKAVLVKAPVAGEKIQDDPPKAEKKPEKQVAASSPPAPKPAESKPAEKPAPKPAVEKKTPAPLQTYTTGAKDTFYSVARKYKVKVDDLMKLNGINDPSKLRAGMKLKVPAKD